MTGNYTTKQLALGFGVQTRIVQSHLKKLTENVDFIKTQSNALGKKEYSVTNEGVKKLSQIINTEEAKQFANQLAVQEITTDPTNPLFWQHLLQMELIGKEYLQKALDKANEQIKKLASLELNVDKLKDLKGLEQHKKDRLGSIINNCVDKKYFHKTPTTYMNEDGIIFVCSKRDRYAIAHTYAKNDYNKVNELKIPDTAKEMTLEMKQTYCNWLLSI